MHTLFFFSKRKERTKEVIFIRFVIIFTPINIGLFEFIVTVCVVLRNKKKNYSKNLYNFPLLLDLKKKVSEDLKPTTASDFFASSDPVAPSSNKRKKSVSMSFFIISIAEYIQKKF